MLGRGSNGSWLEVMEGRRVSQPGGGLFLSAVVTMTSNLDLAAVVRHIRSAIHLRLAVRTRAVHREPMIDELGSFECAGGVVGRAVS